MKISPKSVLKRAAAVVLAAVLALGVFAAQACKKTEEQNAKLIEAQKNPGAAGEKLELTDLQKQNILAAAEAFYELGIAYDEQNPIKLTMIEEIMSCVYNNELKAGEDGFGRLPLKDAESRMKNLLGFETFRHTLKKTNAVQDYYCEGDTYYIRVKEPAAECEITSSEWTEDGLAKIVVNARGSDGTAAVLEFTAELKDGDLTVRSCKRYDEK